MPKILKYIGYFFMFIAFFFIFLYWSFPYDIVKERLLSTIEQQLGEGFDARAASLSPSFFTGAVLRDVKIIKHDGDKSKQVFGASKVKLRMGLGAIILGKWSATFNIKNTKGSVSGAFKRTEDGYNISADLNDFNLADLNFLVGDTGLKLTSDIDGSVKLTINKRQMMQSFGVADMVFDNIKIAQGELRLGEGGTFQIPELVLASGGGLKLELARGSIRVKEFKLQEGDLKMDLGGDLFLSPVVKNYRMNLRGNFSVSSKMEQAIPFLFMIEKQRQPDGFYPLTVTGRFAQPSIKVGEFTLPF